MSRLFGESVPRKSQRQENVPSHIFTPRSYQVEILDTALRRNTIVCLGSSTGKAFIATMLIKSLAHQIRPPRSQGGKRTVFLANTRDVVQHQAGVFTRETDLSIGRFVKVSSVGRRDTERWNRELDKYHVLAMTPRVLLEMFAHGHLTFSDINLIIFDECEQVNTKHPYAEVMAAYIALNLPDPPRILGLTASVLSDGVATPEELEKKIKRLELSLNSTAETSTDMIVADLYGAKPREVVLQCAGYEDQTGLVARIEEVLQAGLGFLQDTNMTWGGEGENTEDPKVIPRIVYTECLNILRLLGPWCAGRVAQAFCKQLYKLEDVETDPKHKRFLQMTHTSLQMIHTMVDYDYENVVQCLEDFLKYMSPKVLKLFDTLRSYKPDDNFMIVGGDDFSDMDFGGDASDDSMDLTDEEEEGGDGGRRDRAGTKPQVHYVAMKRTVTGENGCALEKPADDGLCGLIFVERRHTAFALNKLIQEMCNWDADLYFIQSCHITGKSNHKPGAAVREAEVVYRKQEEVLRQFRNKEVNLLVSTSVLEEGVDVPRCNLVFRFDSPTDYRSYVQSKGRARAPRSTFFMLVDDPNLQAFTKNLDIFKGIENILLGRCQCQEELREEAVDIAHADQLLPPYVPAAASPGVRVTMSTAILLVNRYCAKLPSDAFTHLTPKCTTVSHRVGDTNQYVATLQLPINSPIKEPITGEPMSNKRYAKMAVALQTCEILHRKGELDDNLLPVGKEVIRYEDEEGEWEETQGQARPGTTKRKQYYYKKPADAILGHPPLGEKCYLYMVRMILTCPITEEQNTRGRKIHDPEETPRGFGILSKRKIPLVPRFPVFTRSGEVTTSIDLVSEDMAIGESEYTRLKHFHHKVFTHVLRLEKDPMKFDLDNAVTGYIVVPLARGEAESFSIDWDFIATVEQAPLNNNRKMIFEKEREGFAFDRKVFEDAVVMPSYRNIDQPQYFYVAEIRHDLNPRSPFPSPELYDTFEHYYASKYSLEMTNLDQPLLDVDHTSARLNLLTPRYMNQKGVALPTSSAETRRARRENLQQKQILVPELCDVHPFPASLWRKAVCLPAIFYRMNCLLIADEIRMMIAQGAHIGVVNLPDDFRFQQLEFGFSTKPSDAIQEGKDPAPDPGGSDNEDSDQGSREELAQVADKSSDEQSTASDEEKEGSDQGTDQDGEDGNSNDQEKSLSADEEMPSECADLIKTEPADKVKQSIKKEICSPSKPTNYEVCPESKPQSVIENLTSECNGVNLSDSQTKTTSLVETNSCSNKSNRPQDLIKTEQMIPNGPVPIDCNCTEETEINGLSEKPCKSEINEESVTEAVPLDSPLFIDTTPTSCPPGMVGAESVTQEEGTFHTPRLNLQDLVTGPSSSTSVCSYHTADTSLTPGSSPAHTAHSSPPHTADTSLTPGSSPAHTAHSSPPHTADTSLTPGSSPSHTKPSTLPHTADTSLSPGSSPAHTAHSSPPHTADTSLTPGSSPSHTKHSTPPHTADTSLTPGSSPTHTKHSTPPHTTDTSLTPGSSPSHTKHFSPPQEDRISTSQNSLPSTSDESPTPLTNHHSNWPNLDTSLPSSDQTTGVSPSSPPTGQTTDQPTSSNKACHCEAVQQCIDNTDTDFSHVGKESKDCDMDRRAEAKDGVTDSCLCSRNGTIKVAKCPRCAEQCACELETAAIPKVSPIVDDKPTQEPQALTEHPEDSLQESETVCNHVSTDSEQKPGCEVENSDLEKDSKEVVLPHGQNEDTTEDQSEPSANTKLGKMDSLCDFDSDLSSDSDSEVSTEPEEEKKKEEEEKVRPVITFDQQVDLDTFIGPSPCVILQTMTMSNANDFFNLERLETIGDSFLKFAITVYLYCTYPGIHEGKLSYLRSKQVSNYNLYKLGKKKGFPDCMVAAKFEPTENWLPPGFIIKTSNAYKGINVVIASSQNKYGAQQSESGEGVANSEDGGQAQGLTPEEKFRAELEEATRPEECDKTEDGGGSGVRTLIPYNLQTQHSLPDKSIADCVEALIGCYLTTCGQRAALQFMSWLGLKVLPELNPASGPAPSTNCNILLTTINRPAVKGTGQGGAGSASGFGHLQAPNSPLLTHVPHASDILHHHLDGYESFERRIQYTFRDRAYLLQAFTHASYHYNNITDCYQRLEFLGDAILDYVITRHLFEDVKKHSPGILTDLRSALVNNNIFAALAVKWEFHKYFKAISPQLFNVIEKFVARQKEKHDEISLDEEFDEGEEEKGQETEDIEIPKALGDIFESVAGAIYLDSGMSLDTVWRVYYRMMKPQIDMFTAKIPKSPVRELLELEPETAKFEKPERTLDGKIRVMVNVVGKGEFRGIGRNYRIAKSAAAKRALKMIRLMDEQMTHQQLSLQYGIPQFTHHHFAGLGGGRM